MIPTSVDVQQRQIQLQEFIGRAVVAILIGWYTEQCISQTVDNGSINLLAILGHLSPQPIPQLCIGIDRLSIVGNQRCEWQRNKGGLPRFRDRDLPLRCLVMTESESNRCPFIDNSWINIPVVTAILRECILTNECGQVFVIHYFLIFGFV